MIGLPEMNNFSMAAPANLSSSSPNQKRGSRRSVAASANGAASAAGTPNIWSWQVEEIPLEEPESSMLTHGLPLNSLGLSPSHQGSGFSAGRRLDNTDGIVIG